MESLALASGNIEALVAVLSRDLTNAYNYLRIAQVHRDAGQLDQALLWAEKGLGAFPQRTDSRLREFAAEEYHRVQRHEDAANLMSAEFFGRPSLQTYQTLERHAKRAGTWPEWRDRALAEFRLRIAKAKERSEEQKESAWLRPIDDHSRLVEIFLYEHNADAAWHEAQEGGCSEALWLHLADARGKEHPADAVPIYLKRAEAGVKGGGGNYDDPVALLIKAAAAMKRLDRSDEFEQILEALRAKYKVKRNFIKLVEQNRKSLYFA